MIVNGIRFHTEEAGNGAPFIWAHGLMSSIASEGSQFLAFDKLAQSNHVVRYDARGHGRTDASANPEDYRWDHLAGDMLGIASKMGIHRFFAGGASMGCATSLFAALQAPDRVAGLVLVIPPTAWETRAAQASLYDKMATYISTHSIESLPALFAEQPPHWSSSGTPEEQVDALRPMYGHLPTVLQGAGFSNLPDKELLKEIQAPALILCWTDDPGHPVSTAEELHRVLPNARLVRASNQMEMASWTDLVDDFLREHKR